MVYADIDVRRAKSNEYKRKNPEVQKRAAARFHAANPEYQRIQHTIYMRRVRSLLPEFLRLARMFRAFG